MVSESCSWLATEQQESPRLIAIVIVIAVIVIAVIVIVIIIVMLMTRKLA